MKKIGYNGNGANHGPNLSPVHLTKEGICGIGENGETIDYNG